MPKNWDATNNKAEAVRPLINCLVKFDYNVRIKRKEWNEDFWSKRVFLKLVNIEFNFFFWGGVKLFFNTKHPATALTNLLKFLIQGKLHSLEW